MSSLQRWRWMPYMTTALILSTATFSNNHHGVLMVHANSGDGYCGTNWPNAQQQCLHPCPSGDDSECREGHECFFFTGCSAKNQGQGQGQGNQGQGQGQGNTQGLVGGNVGGGSVSGGSGANNNFCGASFIDAMVTCNIPCPTDNERCPSGQCYAATNCDKPLARLQADMLVTLTGADTMMENEDNEIFGETMREILQDAVGEEGVALDEVGLGEQSMAGRRVLEKRYKKRELKGWHAEGGTMDRSMQIKVKGVKQRRLASGSSALDVSMVITGDYRPPPYLDLNVIAEDSINRSGEKVVSTLRERGDRAGRDFFQRVDGIEAVAKESSTERPTKKPTYYPTLVPTIAPSSSPSWPPSEAPSAYPSGAPSRQVNQIIMTGSQEDLQLGGTTTSSYGYIFNIRTKPDSGVVLVHGFDFYTENTEDVTFKLYTRAGSFKDYKGDLDAFDLIASGTVKGRGIGRYTSLPEETLTPVSIRGGGGEGGTRAFYLTLTEKQLVYKIGEGTDSDSAIQYETEDIEVWEGESVLAYPFPSAEDFFYYRYPRQYLGAIRYNRLPCEPYSLYGLVLELPCPFVPTGSPTIPPPTRTPVTEPPSGPPTLSPVGIPTVSPTISRAPAGIPTIAPTEPHPTESPTTAKPSGSPVVPMRANIISVFRNVAERDMTQREIEKFLEITTEFLKRRTQESMVIDGIDLWHHKLTTADADTANTAPQVAKKTRNSGNHNVKAKQNQVTQVTSVEITMILRIVAATLPLEYLGNLAAVIINENQVELLALLNEQSAFYSYFKTMDGITSRAVEVVTGVPTGMPSTYAHFLANSQEVLMDEGEEEESDGGVGMMVFVGLGVGGLWCCLTIISISYLMKRRAQMLEQHDMEDLLRQEKVMENDGEIGGGGVDVVKRKDVSRPTDGDEEEPTDEWDESKKVETSVVVKAGGSNSVTNTSRSSEARGGSGNKVGSITNTIRRSSEASSRAGESRQGRRKPTILNKGSLKMSGLTASFKGSFNSNASSGGRASPAPSRTSRRMSRKLSKSFDVASKRQPSRQHNPNMAQSMVASSAASRASDRSSFQGNVSTVTEQTRTSQNQQSMVASSAGSRANDRSSFHGGSTPRDTRRSASRQSRYIR